MDRKSQPGQSASESESEDLQSRSSVDPIASEHHNDWSRLRSNFVPYSKADFYVYAVVSLVLCLFFSMVTYSTIWSYPWQSHWARTTGKITAIKPGYKLWHFVRYSYQAADRQYEGEEGFQLHGFVVSTGQPATVRYDPAKPAISVIETGVTLATFIWLAATAASGLSFFACIYSIAHPAKNT